MVQPAPTPFMPDGPSTNMEMSSSANEAGSSQNEMLFMRGNAMSGAPICNGTNQLPNPPIMAGITMKNTMMRPWPVTNTLYMWPLAKYWSPGSCSSMRTITDRNAPIVPATMANSRYIVPMSLWFVEFSQRDMP